MTSEPPEPFKSALIDTLKTVRPSLRVFAFFKVADNAVLPSRISLYNEKERHHRVIHFRALPGYDRIPFNCVIQWRY